MTDNTPVGPCLDEKGKSSEEYSLGRFEFGEDFSSVPFCWLRCASIRPPYAYSNQDGSSIHKLGEASLNNLNGNPIRLWHAGVYQMAILKKWLNVCFISADDAVRWSHYEKNQTYISPSFSPLDRYVP